MARVGERSASPSTTNRSSTNSSSSCNSKDHGKPRRSYYRLFPTVEPTPPASPVSLVNRRASRASLRNSSACGSYRRRSSSEDNGRGASSRDPHCPPHVLTNFATSSLNDGRQVSPPEQPALRTVQEDKQLSDAAGVQSGLNTAQSGVDQARASTNHNHRNGFDSVLVQSSKACDTSTAFDMAAHGKCHDGPARLPGTVTTPAIGLGLDIPSTLDAEDNQPGTIFMRTKPRPNLRIAILEEQNNESEPLSPPKSSRHTREDSTESISNATMNSLSLSQDGSAVRASVALKQSIVPLSAALKVRELNVAPHGGRLRASKSFPVKPVGSSQEFDTAHTARLQDPPNTSIGVRADLPSLTSRMNRRAAAPEAYPLTTTPEPYPPAPMRPATARAATTTSAKSISHVDQPRPVSSGQSALATARANVAAFSNVEVPTWNASFFEQTQTPRPEVASLFSAPLHRGHDGISDPVRTLAELSKQCEALYARHTSLRAQRVQLSSAIVANMNSQKSGPASGDMLHEQLSLAAVSSSIDICFAKLKSLECQREDAIAVLVAQASGPRRDSDNSIPMSRKSSFAPSMDSGSRLASGRSTPDIHSLYRSNRPPPIKTYSSRSETDPQRVRSPLPRTSSLPYDSGTEAEPKYDRLVAQQPKRLTQISEPPGTPDLSFETAGASSTADEADDAPNSDFSDMDDMLAEELFRKPHRKNADGKSMKAVKVLGLELEDLPPGTTPPPVSPMSSLFSGAKRKKSKPPPPLKLKKDSGSKSSIKVSPLTSSTVHPSEQDQRDHELELQLQSFPPTPGRSAPASLPPSGPPRVPSSVGTITSKRTIRRHDSPVTRSNTGKSSTSAHTINVYYDFDPDEALPPMSHQALPTFPHRHQSHRAIFTRADTPPSP